MFFWLIFTQLDFSFHAIAYSCHISKVDYFVIASTRKCPNFSIVQWLELCFVMALLGCQGAICLKVSSLKRSRVCGKLVSFRFFAGIRCSLSLCRIQPPPPAVIWTCPQSIKSIKPTSSGALVFFFVVADFG